jgi:hypothetical protein
VFALALAHVVHQVDVHAWSLGERAQLVDEVLLAVVVVLALDALHEAVDHELRDAEVLVGVAHDGDDLAPLDRADVVVQPQAAISPAVEGFQELDGWRARPA